MSIESKQPTAAPKSAAASLEASFTSALSALKLRLPLALAVSGGGDSVAMMHLFAKWAQAQGIDATSIFVLTVDHGLRDGSAQEAAQVSAWARDLGFGHTTLLWEGDKPSSRLQERARAARYDLMCQWCVNQGVQDLALAHTSTDQSETVGMRLLKGSGTKGLAGMLPERQGAQGIRIVRPLLNCSGEALRAWLRGQGKVWIDDPSNENQSFDRIRMRKALADQPPLISRLDELNEVASDARTAMDAAVDDLLRDMVQMHAGPWARIEVSVLCSAPQEIALQGISRLLHGLGGAGYQPNRVALKDLLEHVSAPTFKAATLGGCIIASEGNHLLVGREGRNITSLTLTQGQEGVWDHRVRVGLVAANEASTQPLSVRIGGFGQWGLDVFDPVLREQIKQSLPAPLRNGAMVAEFSDGRYSMPFAGIGDWTGLSAHFGGFQPFTGHRLDEDVSSAC